MKARDFMVEKVIAVRPDMNVKDAVDIMNENELGCLVVKTRSGEPIGIMTERDVLTKIVSDVRDPEKAKVSEVMSHPLVVGKVDMDVEEAAKLMFKRNIKKLPIVDGEKLAGLITFTDIVRVNHAGELLLNVIRQLRKNGWNPTKRINKVVEIYVT